MRGGRKSKRKKCKKRRKRTFRKRQVGGASKFGDFERAVAEFFLRCEAGNARGTKIWAAPPCNRRVAEEAAEAEHDHQVEAAQLAERIRWAACARPSTAPERLESNFTSSPM